MKIGCFARLKISFSDKKVADDIFIFFKIDQKSLKKSTSKSALKIGIFFKIFKKCQNLSRKHRKDFLRFQKWLKNRVKNGPRKIFSKKTMFCCSKSLILLGGRNFFLQKGKFFPIKHCFILVSA